LRGKWEIGMCRRLFGALFVMSLLLGSAGAEAQAATLDVGAAADLETVLSQGLVPAFHRLTGATVVMTYGSTQLLATQLENQAPIGLFLAADSVTPRRLAVQGILIPQSVHVYAIGKLVIWSRKQAAHHPTNIKDLTNSVYAKIAIANPLVAPYGLAAMQSLAHSGIMASVASRLVTAENIGQCLQYARTGNAAVALTSLSLVITDHRDPYVIVPNSFHAPIAQSLGIVKGSGQEALAARFSAFLSSPAADKIWKQYGYGLPGKSQ
jgi:molybdate transport system substrate-binding protein